MLIRASTQRFSAGSLLTPTPSVETAIGVPKTVTVAEADTTVVPVVLDVMVTTQSPPLVTQVLPPTKEPGPLSIVAVTRVPSGASVSTPAST